MKNQSELAMFEVVGPFKVPLEKRPGGSKITRQSIAYFWQEHPLLRNKVGCYVFGWRAGRGFSPGYVGKTMNCFEREVFTPRNLVKYDNFMSFKRKGAPVIFFLITTSRRGRPNAEHVDELEAFLIQHGVQANVDLENVKGTRRARWGVSGLIRSKQGRTGRAVGQLRQMFNLKSKATAAKEATRSARAECDVSLR